MHFTCFKILNPNSIGEEGGAFYTIFAKLRTKKCPCSRNNDTAVAQQISLFETALVKDTAQLAPPLPNTIKEYFTPI